MKCGLRAHQNSAVLLQSSSSPWLEMHLCWDSQSLSECSGNYSRISSLPVLNPASNLMAVMDIRTDWTWLIIIITVIIILLAAGCRAASCSTLTLLCCSSDS